MYTGLKDPTSTIYVEDLGQVVHKPESHFHGHCGQLFAHAKRSKIETKWPQKSSHRVVRSAVSNGNWSEPRPVPYRTTFQLVMQLELAPW